MKMRQMAEAVDEFEVAFAQRMLVSEERRAKMMAWVFSLLALVSVGVNLLYRHFDQHLPGIEFILLTFVAAAGYEWLTNFIFQKLAARKRPPGRVRFYANTLVESSLPTLTLAVMLNFMDATLVLTSSITYLYFLIIILSALRLDFRLSVFSGVVAATGFATLVLWRFPEILATWDSTLLQLRINFGLRIVFLTTAGIVAGLVGLTIRSNLRETMSGLSERQRIVSLFGQHVSPEVVNRLLTQPREPTSSQREVCIMVLDIRKFTTFSEDRAADEVVSYLNTLWGALVRVVNAHHGIVNKFLGDGFLAVFGVPGVSDHYCPDAVAAARKILEEVERLVATGEIPPTEVGLALHAGVAIVGIIGSEERKEFTVIGDVVNVTFRIEALNKELNSRLLISAPVRERAGPMEAIRLEPIPIRGRREPIELFRLA